MKKIIFAFFAAVHFVSYQFLLIQTHTGINHYINDIDQNIDNHKQSGCGQKD